MNRRIFIGLFASTLAVLTVPRRRVVRTHIGFNQYWYTTYDGIEVWEVCSQAFGGRLFRAIARNKRGETQYVDGSVTHTAKVYCIRGWKDEIQVRYDLVNIARWWVEHTGG